MAGSAGISAWQASSSQAPAAPNTAKAARQVSEAEAAALPTRRALEAAAQQGGKTTVWVDKHTEQQKLVKVNGQKVPYVEADWKPGGKYYTGKKPEIITKNVKVPAGYQEVDFKGYGEADVQGKVAQQNAASQLALRQKYDSQFIDEALKQQAEADPLGTAARQKEYDLIQAEQNRTPDRPVAELLDKQVTDQLAAGRNLDGVSQEMLDAAVTQAQAARGDQGRADFADPLTSGFAGDARAQAAQAKAQSWLAGGATPEDVQYRREQQRMANLGAFTAGQTPQSQFQTMSGAQTGATPLTQGQPLARQNPNAGAVGNNAALSAWNTQMGYDLNQANSWTAGLSMILNGMGAMGQAGWKPFSTGGTGGTGTTTQSGPPQSG